MLNLQIITESGREIIGDEPRNNLDYSLEYKPTDWTEQPPIEKYRFISEIARYKMFTLHPIMYIFF